MPANPSETVSMTRNATTMDRTSDCELVIRRTFNGPPSIVFEAWTRPEHVRRWWAPRSREVSIVSVDAEIRVGGGYRYVFEHAKHGRMAFSGRYLEVTRPSRLVHTEIFEPSAEGGDEAAAAVVTVTFNARGDQTDVVSHSRLPSKEILDQIIGTGMEGGMREAMDQLDELVASLHRARE